MAYKIVTPYQIHIRICYCQALLLNLLLHQAMLVTIHLGAATASAIFRTRSTHHQVPCHTTLGQLAGCQHFAFQEYSWKQTSCRTFKMDSSWRKFVSAGQAVGSTEGQAAGFSSSTSGCGAMEERSPEKLSGGCWENAAEGCPRIKKEGSWNLEAHKNGGLCKAGRIDVTVGTYMILYAILYTISYTILCYTISYTISHLCIWYCICVRYHIQYTM